MSEQLKPCCLTTREACAKIADKVARHWADFDQYSDAARYAPSRAEIAQCIAEAIREYEESKEKGK